MREMLLLKCGELVLKGLNRNRFEERLLKTIRMRLKPLGEYKVYSKQATVYVEPQGGAGVSEALERLKKVFGIVAIQRAVVCEKDMNDIREKAIAYLRPLLEKPCSFKVMARRSDKRFPFGSPEIGAMIGGDLHDAYPHLVPKMDDPDVLVKVEIREEYAFVSGETIPGAGGMPCGSNGRAMLLLSGGIDSPVAGYRMAKRGLELCAVHFFSYPYTSEEAKEKVLELARRLSFYTGRLTVCLIPFTHIQQEIRDKCEESYFTLVMRRLMMMLAERAAARQDCAALITGESLGQVASQTIESLTVTGDAVTLPVFRPLIGMDKEEIIETARAIDTFDVSILPYEDCCTVFTPRHPQTRPQLARVLEQEQRLTVDALLDEAMEGMRRVTVRPDSEIGKEEGETI